ncbi:27352_t:CDS:2, partial [Dentiscutata erythropus]
MGEIFEYKGDSEEEEKYKIKQAFEEADLIPLEDPDELDEIHSEAIYTSRLLKYDNLTRA